MHDGVLETIFSDLARPEKIHSYAVADCSGKKGNKSASGVTSPKSAEKKVYLAILKVQCVT